jgi:pimeloyl-ACP methyl ester carboxylesterase
MSAPSVRVLLIPGAWMGAWIWEPVVQRLRDRGIDAESMTLAGLEPGATAARVAAVRLADHVDQVTQLVTSGDGPVVLVAHSYSGLVAGQVADGLGGRVATSVHFGSFLPVHGQSLLDQWGAEETSRARERADIIDAGYRWAPPTPAGLAADPGLTREQREYLTERFTPHPGRTVLDPATLRDPVHAQRGTFVASAPALVPALLQSPAAEHWRVQTLPSGHWPMLEDPDRVTMLIAKHATATVPQHHPAATALGE